MNPLSPETQQSWDAFLREHHEKRRRAAQAEPAKTVESAPAPEPAPEPMAEAEPEPEPEAAPEPMAEPELDAMAEPEADVDTDVDADENVVWWAPINLPKSAAIVFSDPALCAELCGFCCELQNVVVDERGRVTQVFCGSCRIVIGRYEPNLCTGAAEGCEGRCYVDEVGAVSALCKECHQHEEGFRRRRRRGGQRGSRAQRRPRAWELTLAI